MSCGRVEIDKSFTISRFAGLFCGALKGIDNVPLDMLEKVEKACIGVIPYMDKPISQIAEELTEAVEAHGRQLENNLNQLKKLL